MSIVTTICLCIGTFIIGIITAAYAFVPEQYPVNYYTLAGWFSFMITIILWELGE